MEDQVKKKTGAARMANNIKPKAATKTAPKMTKGEKNTSIAKDMFSGAGKSLGEAGDWLTGTDAGKQTLIAALPMLGGALFGGNEGLAHGAKAAGQGLNVYEKGKDKAAKSKALSAKSALSAKYRAQDVGFKKRGLDLKEKEIDTKSAEALRKRMEKENPSIQMRLSKMGAEERKRFDNIQMGQSALNDMANSLTSGDRTFSLIGDNNFTFASSRWEEAIGRMQSGGAINSDEGERFKKLIPGPMDSREMQTVKLQKMANLMSSRLKSFGIVPDELEGFVDPSFQSKIAEYGGVDSSTMGLPTANAAGPKMDYNKVSDAELTKMYMKRKGMQGRGY